MYKAGSSNRRRNKRNIGKNNRNIEAITGNNERYFTMGTLAPVAMASLMLAGTASAQEGGSVSLPTIDIFGGNDGYQTSQSTLSRSPASLINTPQTVNVIPQQVLQDQNTSTVVEALRNVSGITFRAGEGGNQGDSPYIRGMESRGDIFRDGVRDPGWYTRDSFGVESIEVFKGPSSFLFGRGSTGGVINIVTKTPVERTFFETTVTGTTAPGARTTLDANGKVSDNVWARVAVMGQRYDVAGRDYVEENRYGIAPSLKMKLGDSTTATLSYIYQHEISVPDYGIPFLTTAWGIPRQVAPVNRNTFYGILSDPADTTRVDASMLTGKIEHEFNNQLKVTNTTRYSDVLRFQRNVFPEPNANVPPPPNLNANWLTNRAQVQTHYWTLANQTDFIAKFMTGTLDHTLVFGVDINQENRDFHRTDFTQNTSNFIDPDPFRFGGTLTNPTANRITSGTGVGMGTYIADQVKLNRYIELLGGLRYDYFKFDQNAPLADPLIRNLSHVDSNLLSWRAGIIFHPMPNTSIYAMRGTSFNPSAENMSVAIGTTPGAIQNTISTFGLSPEKNETTEFGVKGDILNGRLSLASAVFQTDKTNARVQDPANTSITVLDGVIRARGFEASATGKITDAWQVIASYTYLNARIIKTLNTAQLNNEPIMTPTNSASVWTTYDITPKFQIGGGAYYMGAMYGDLPNTAIVPDYWRFDAMAAYKIDAKSTLQLNVYNLTDKYYYAYAYSNWAVPGQSRMAALTLRTRW